jgi:hypothetical protein
LAHELTRTEQRAFGITISEWRLDAIHAVEAGLIAAAIVEEALLLHHVGEASLAAVARTRNIGIANATDEKVRSLFEPAGSQEESAN